MNPDFYVYRERVKEEFFPWEFIRHRVTKAQLWREYQKTLTEDKADAKGWLQLFPKRTLAY
jgi:hypothetical protein